MTVGLAVVLTVLVWRLTTGPISLAFLTPYFESAFNVPEADFKVRVEDTILTWAGWDQSLDIRLRGARVIGDDGNTVAEIPELAVSLSAKALLQKKILPSSLSVFGPRLNIIRQEDGRLEIGNALNGRQQAGFNNQIVERILTLSKEGRPLAHLNNVNIIGGNVVIDDRLLGVIWEAPEADILLTRQGDKYTARADLTLKAGDKTAALLFEGTYDTKTEQSGVSVGFADLNLRTYAQLSEKLKFLEGFDLPISGTVAAALTRDGNYRSLEFNIASAKGRIKISDPIDLKLAVQTASVRGVFDRRDGMLVIDEAVLDLGKNGELQLPKPIDHKFPIDKIVASGVYNSNFDRVEIKKIELQLPGPTAQASLTVQEIGGDFTFDFAGNVQNISVGTVPNYWPKKWADITRSWIVENMTDGHAPQASVRVTGRWNAEKGVELHSVAGDMAIREMTVDYLPPMPKAVHTSGQAKFDRKRFEIQIEKGEVEGLKLETGKIVFTDLDKFDQFADVDLSVDGPLQAVMKLIDHEPLGFTKAVGLSAGNVEGVTATKIKLHFLVDRKLTANQVKAQVKSNLQDVSIKNIAHGFDLKNANLTLAADNQRMIVKGRGALGGIESKIEWRENIADKKSFRSRYKILADVSDKQWRKNLGLNFVPFNADYLNGKLAAEIIATIKNDGKGELLANLDLKDAALQIPEFQWQKSAKVSAHSEIKAVFSAAGFQDIPAIKIKGGGMDFEGRANFNSQGEFKSLEIQKLLFGESDITGFITLKTTGLVVDISGERLDLSEWLAKEDENTERNKGQELALNLNSLKQVKIYPDKFLENVAAKMNFDGLVWREVHLTATLGPGESLVVDVIPEGEKRRLKVVSNDAGAALRKFELYENLIGGQLSVEAVYDSLKPDSRLKGTAKIDNFRIVKAPVLAQLLSIASLTGILENLGDGGFGLTFDKLEAPFVKEYGIIKVESAAANGISLGLTASGDLDTQTKLVDIKGTVVPAYILNTALTRIPLIGSIFSGGEKGGGVFAARYSMTGDVQNPDISTNPLSTLTPGFLRNLFDVFEDVEGVPPDPNKPYRR